MFLKIKENISKIKQKISNFFTYMKGELADSPYGYVNLKDRLAAIRASIYSTFSPLFVFLGGFFGPEFFQNISEFLFGLNIPKNSVTSIIFALIAWGLGSACVYFAELQRRKFKDYLDKGDK